MTQVYVDVLLCLNRGDEGTRRCCIVDRSYDSMDLLHLGIVKWLSMGDAYGYTGREVGEDPLYKRVNPDEGSHSNLHVMDVEMLQPKQFVSRVMNLEG